MQPTLMAPRLNSDLLAEDPAAVRAVPHLPAASRRPHVLKALDCGIPVVAVVDSGLLSTAMHWDRGPFRQGAWKKNFTCHMPPISCFASSSCVAHMLMGFLLVIATDASARRVVSVPLASIRWNMPLCNAPRTPWDATGGINVAVVADAFV